MPGYRLFGYFRSSASYRVRVGLHHKGIPFAYEAVNLLHGEQLDAPYTGTNPMREVPTLEITADDGTVRRLAQSVAILEYLEETHPERPLLPADPWERALVRQRVEAVNASIQPVQNLRVMKKIAADYGASREETFAWGAYWIARGFEGLEPLLAETAGAHAVGDAVSLADVFLVPQVFNARRFGVDMAPFPTIARVDEAATALPAFQAAAPERQPDAPDASDGG